MRGRSAREPERGPGGRRRGILLVLGGVNINVCEYCYLGRYDYIDHKYNIIIHEIKCVL